MRLAYGTLRDIQLTPSFLCSDEDDVVGNLLAQALGRFEVDLEGREIPVVDPKELHIEREGPIHISNVKRVEAAEPVSK